MTLEKMPSFLVDYLYNSFIPTGMLTGAKVLGLLPFSWAWVILPTVSAAFFLTSFLLAGAILRTANNLANHRS